jgi:hypothetical protein
VGTTCTIGAGIPLKVTLTPSSDEGSVDVVKLAACAESCEVKIATSAPGDTGLPAPLV